MVLSAIVVSFYKPFAHFDKILTTSSLIKLTG